MRNVKGYGMNKSVPLRLTVIAAALLASAGAHAVDAFDPATNLLTMDAVTMTGTTYKNVAVTVNSYTLLSTGAGSPADTFDPNSNLLVLGTVAYQGSLVNNANVRINSYTLLSAGGPGTAGTQGSPNYSGEMAAYLSTLNNYRTQCGVPALAQNTLLDAAAVNVGTTVGLGAQVSQATAAGYAVPSTVGAVRSDYWSNSTNTTAVGQYQAKMAIMDPYALLTLMRPYTEIGMYYRLQQAGATNQRGARVALGNPISRNTPSPVTFPCANSTDIPTGMPYTTGAVYYVGSPVGGTSGNGTMDQTSLRGAPIAVFANPGQTLVITNAAVTAQGGGGVPISIRDATKTSTDAPNYAPSDKMLYGYEGYVWPQQPLQANTAYDVVIFGTVDGVAFGKNFTFRTGAAIPIWFP